MKILKVKRKPITKDDILTAVALYILLMTSLINWTLYSWLILLAVIMLAFTWYNRSK